MKIDWKKVWAGTWPHIVAIATFVILTIVYFAPEFFDNKKLPQGDVQSSIGMGQDAREYYERTGEYVDWSNAMFGGMPYNMCFTQTSKSVFSKISPAIHLLQVLV